VNNISSTLLPGTSARGEVQVPVKEGLSRGALSALKTWGHYIFAKQNIQCPHLHCVSKKFPPFNCL